MRQQSSRTPIPRERAGEGQVHRLDRLLQLVDLPQGRVELALQTGDGIFFDEYRLGGIRHDCQRDPRRGVDRHRDHRAERVLDLERLRAELQHGLIAVRERAVFFGWHHQGVVEVREHGSRNVWIAPRIHRDWAHDVTAATDARNRFVT
ncbi:MAG TPA: hypothetical protein VEU30_10615 [Thermoanaerobaculia bacterium]|nr:hypothetical protein [Thermoanaerobaculia bacterium]